MMVKVGICSIKPNYWCQICMKSIYTNIKNNNNINN